jgi:hypothetical protein
MLLLKDAKKIYQNVKFSNSRNRWLRSNGENRVITEITLTPEDLIRKYEEQDGLCYWSELELRPEFNYIKRHPLAISVERVDNSKGYTYENVKLVIRMFNLGRCSYQGDFHEIVDSLKRRIIYGS